MFYLFKGILFLEACFLSTEILCKCIFFLDFIILYLFVWFFLFT